MERTNTLEIMVWSGIGYNLWHGAMRVHTLLPLSLLELGHKVYTFVTYTANSDNLPSEIKEDFAKLPMEPLMNILDAPAADVAIFIDTPHIFCREWLKSQPKLDWIDTVRGKTNFFVYYCLDYWEGCYGVNELMLAAEAKLIECSTHVLAVSPQLCTYLSKRYNTKVYWLPNAARFKWLTCSPQHLNRKNIAVFTGTAYTHTDLDALYKVALEHKDWIFLCFGTEPAKEQILSHTPAGNLFFLEAAYGSKLVYVLHQAKVGLFPARRNPFSYFGDTTKWYTYHAAGLAIVEAPPQPHHIEFPRFYPNTFTGYTLEEAFEKYLEAEAKGGITPQVLEIHDYSYRAKALVQILTEGYSPYGAAESGIFTPTEVVM